MVNYLSINICIILVLNYVTFFQEDVNKQLVTPDRAPIIKTKETSQCKSSLVNKGVLSKLVIGTWRVQRHLAHPKSSPT